MKTIFTLVLVVVSFVLGVYVGHHPLADLVLGSTESSTYVASTREAANSQSGGATSRAQGSVVVSTAQLSAEQRALLEKLGIDADAITITPEMLVCAEAKLGPTRIAEIQAGATPTFTEGASLVACYR